MPFKDRLKRTFGKKSGTSSGEWTRSTSEEYSYTGRTDVEYYKPHEIPRSKYRGRVDPEHKEQLESFCFSDAFSSSPRRKPSLAMSGIMSPGGTKSQSRRASYVSETSEDADSSASTLETQQTSLSSTSSEEDTTTASFDTGLSREQTLQPGPPPPTSAFTSKLGQEAAPDSTTEYSELITPPDEQPFTMDELERAMTQITLRASHNTENRNSLIISAH